MSDKNVKHATTAIVIKVGDEYFAGFSGGPGMTKAETLTKLRPGLCEAKLIGGNNTGKAADYIRRLTDKGYEATAYEVQISKQLTIIARKK